MSNAPVGRSRVTMIHLWWIGITVMTLCLYKGISGQSLVDPHRLKTTLRDGFSKPRSYTQTTDKQAIRLYITNFFKGLSAYDFRQEDYTAPHDGGSYTGSNLIWLLRGIRYGTPDDAVFVIGAHYDTHSETSGVDNNGSGMTVLLEVAKALSQQNNALCTRLNSVIFVAFDWGEYGILGSFEFTDKYLVPQFLQNFGIPLAKFQGAVILDTIMNWDSTSGSQTLPSGFGLLFPDLASKLKSNQNRGDFLLATSRQDDQQLMSALSQQWAAMPLASKYGFEQLLLPYSGRPSQLSTTEQQWYSSLHSGDHYRFWNHQSTNYALSGLKAVFLTDTSSLRGYMKNCYQKACDNMDPVTDERLQFMAKISETLARVALEKATEKDDLQCAGAPDVDECLVNKGGCTQICKNTQGGFVCSCNPGFVLAADGRTCTGLIGGFEMRRGQYHVILVAVLIGCWMARK